MFTGIVSELGTVVAVGGVETGKQLVIDAPEIASRVSVGDSVSVAGVCLTVFFKTGETQLAFHAVPETLARTTLGRLAAGDRVNLEPALRVGDPLGGHIVQGHVDAIGTVRSNELEGAGMRVWIDAPEPVLRHCVEKGSVAVDGVSLTVAALDDDGFAVALIPHTLAVTTLGALEPGDAVNLEPDVLAKYVERQLAARLP